MNADVTLTEVADSPARIVSRREIVISPWVRLSEKRVQFAPGQTEQVYHSVALADYITILAQTPDGRIPIVRQFRPAVEQYTWELPAGLVDAGESPEEACRRELKEETGLTVVAITPLGTAFPDTGRLENRMHAFYVEASGPESDFEPEPGMMIDYVTLPDLKARIRAGDFHLQLHIGVVLLNDLRLSNPTPSIESSRL
jgi:ADP-ribose pyrophosphatase